MVTFVCGGCNSSLKKSQVQFHGCNSKFACITCNKDFNKVSFKEHDRCITEAEKYQGVDFKPKINKGDCRQDSWNNAIIDVFEKYQINDTKLRNVINQLKLKTNIPQKERQFMNFINNINASRLIPRCGEILWSVVSKYKSSLQSTIGATNANNAVEKVNEKITIIPEDNDKKNKRKYRENIDEFDNKNECNVEETPKKKSKIANNETLTTIDESQVKKNKNAKKKETIDDSSNVYAPFVIIKEKKKNKKSKNEKEMIASIALTEENIETENLARMDSFIKVEEPLIITKEKKKNKKSKSDKEIIASTMTEPNIELQNIGSMEVEDSVIITKEKKKSKKLKDGEAKSKTEEMIVCTSLTETNIKTNNLASMEVEDPVIITKEKKKSKKSKDVNSKIVDCALIVKDKTKKKKDKKKIDFEA